MYNTSPWVQATLTFNPRFPLSVTFPLPAVKFGVHDVMLKVNK